MHRESLEGMENYLRKYVQSAYSILDVGSLNYKKKGCYKQILPGDYTYIGVDLIAGRNVDIIVKPYEFPFPDDNFDFVISGQCFEHVENPFRLIKECARVLKTGGYFIGVAPMAWPQHKHPVDCWRILPDGWNAMFMEAGLSTVETHINEIEPPGFIDCWGIAKK